MAEMTLLRKSDLSLYYYIKDTVLCDFFEAEENKLLDYVVEISTENVSEVYVALTEMLPSPTERGRGWLYFDTVSGTMNSCGAWSTVSGSRADGVMITSGTPEQSNRIVVYDSLGNVISSSDYMIDYLDGRIITDGTTETPVSVDYYWHYVSVVDEWAAIEAADPPVIVIDIHGTDKGGYQLGGGKKITRKVDIHIFASDTAERNDLVDAIYDGLYLKGCPVYEFPTGGVLDYDGTFYGRRDDDDKLTTLFDRSTVSSVIGGMEFHNVTSRNVNLPLLMTRNRDEVMLSDLNAYRSKISFDLVSYT